MLCDPHRAVVMGHDFQSQLKATTMSSPDIRAGISLLIAALSAKGTSTKILSKLIVVMKELTND
jgi:UDP-N-acetylglucosamine 1-carboxyvinyltransferase